MIERYKRTRDNCNIHHVPEVSHESTWMQDKALIQNLNITLFIPRNTMRNRKLWNMKTTLKQELSLINAVMKGNSLTSNLLFT